MRDAQAINLSWLLRLRWGAVVGQAAIILGVHFGLGMAQRLVPLFATMAVAAVSNAALGLWARRERPIRERLLWAVMALDVALLTVLLDLSGGPFNPFSALYLVHIALAAVVLRAGWTWALTVLAIASFGALFVDHLWFPSAGGELSSAHPQHHIHDVRMHLEGMWAAFALAAGFIVYFVQRVTRALAAREAELVAARAAAARHEKLTALGTLAAGAAHELSTPLSTIAVAARELERQWTRTGAEATALEDVQLIRQQVARCRDILTQMTLDAGASQGESMVERAPAALVEEALEGLPERERVRTELDARTWEERELVPAHAFARAIRGVVKNALQASGPGKPVRLGLVREAAGWRLTVEDSGEGMPAEVLARAGEPFFTTKAPGEGMGLGLFLTRAVLEQLGGGLVLRSTPGQGTTVVLTWPAGGLRQSAALPAGASRVKPGT
ncbi:MAG TPA: ATP-binding protein [Archangium sp.]|uniref:ATP-binding protein n=1 Tax=Archangium sp. TaxID=1872627 RepID=UPI002E32D96A|nr:ATP-binding protein [Archangium sp.]HEX5748340.1 ATP-binding protein [Archangium sp.]